MTTNRKAIRGTPRSSSRVVLAVSVVALAASAAAAQVPSSLRPALEEMRTELDLSDAQVTEANSLVLDRIARFEAAIDRFGDLNLDSMVDLLAEARSVREEFIPALRGILNDDQRAALAALPKDHQLYVSAMAGWLGEARVRRLRDRVGLSDEQAEQIRTAVTDEYRDGVAIVSGLAGEEGGPGRREMLDALLDLRGVIRQANQHVDQVLDAEQKAALEAWEQEREGESRE